MNMKMKMGIGAVAFAVLTTIAAIAGSLNGIWNFFDRVIVEISAPELAARAAIERFIAVNNNGKHFSYALNSPVSGDTLYVHWKWAQHTGGEYCYYYTYQPLERDSKSSQYLLHQSCNSSSKHLYLIHI